MKEIQEFKKIWNLEVSSPKWEEYVPHEWDLIDRSINNPVLLVDSRLSFVGFFLIWKWNCASHLFIQTKCLWTSPCSDALPSCCSEPLICSDTADKDKGVVYFFIKHPYEEFFKDGLTQEADEIIYTEELPLSSRTMLNKAMLPNTTML